MAACKVKTEHSGAKHTSGYRGDKDMAKRVCRKLRRRIGKAEIRQALGR